MTQKKNHIRYAAILTSKISEIFNEESEHHISLDELKEGNNLTDFFHALSNLIPTYFYNDFTESEKNPLEFNHIANYLVFQYSKNIDDEEG